ncbi:hypothetical protein D3C78_1762660 [compost metagenome]
MTIQTIDENLLSGGHVLSRCAEPLGIFGIPVEKAEALGNLLMVETDTPEQFRQVFCHLHSHPPHACTDAFSLTKKNAMTTGSGQELVSRRFVFQARCPARQSRFPH